MQQSADVKVCVEVGNTWLMFNSIQQSADVKVLCWSRKHMNYLYLTQRSVTKISLIMCDKADVWNKGTKYLLDLVGTYWKIQHSAL